MNDGKTMSPEEFANLSDDEILNMNDAPIIVSADPEPDPEDNTTGENSTNVNDAANDTGAQPDPDDSAGDGTDPNDVDPASGTPGEEDDPDDSAYEGDQPPVAADPHKADADPKPDDKAGEGEAKPNDTAKPGGDTDKSLKPGEAEKEAETKPETKVDFEAEYKQIMAPFKAAGKMIQLNSPDDVIQLMQMGAHYTKKMQALQPNLKLVRMLENNDLLDEGKLSFLIDVSRKDPAAIQKLIRDSGIDPIDIDTSEEPTYTPGNHKVSDEEVAFQTAIEDVASEQSGKDLIISINQSWDKASKEALWGDPNILRILADQKDLGIFDQINDEINRRRTLGYLRNEPFLQAYKAVGEEMQAQGKLVPKPTTQQPAPTPQPESQPKADSRVVETRPAQRKTVSNSDQAKAASPTKAASSTRKPAADFNPLSLSDEEFEKQAGMAQRF